MLWNEKSKVCVFSLLCRVFVAMTVNGDNAVCVFINNTALWIHTECAHLILIILCSVNDFAFIKFVGEVAENNCRKFNTNADVDSVWKCADAEFFTNALHPLAAASADRNYTILTSKRAFGAVSLIISVERLDIVDMCIEMPINLVLKLVINILQNNIVNIRAEMANRRL